MSNKPRTKAETLQSDQQLLAGAQKNAGAIASLLIQGQQRPPSDWETVLGARIKASTTVLSTRAAWQAAVTAANEELTTTQPYVDDLSTQLVAYYAKNPAGLSEYGLTPKKPRTPRTGLKNVVAAARNQATREERGTKGKKQRKDIHGATSQTVVITASGAKLTPTIAASSAPTAASSAPAVTPAVTNGGSSGTPHGQ